MSHSKRNTSLAFFTSYERQQLKNSWGSQKTRLGRDAFLPFGYCTLCLLQATDPVACAGGTIPLAPSSNADDTTQTGSKRKRALEDTQAYKQCHVFCRECIMNNLLSQKKDIKRLEKQMAKEKEDIAESHAIEEEETRNQELADFERTQAGLSTGNGNQKSSKASLSSYWTPGILSDRAPARTLESEKHEKKLAPICPCSIPGQSHPISLKLLVPVKFSVEDQDTKSHASKDATARICPSCTKPLTNATKAIVARPCGHVLCRSCVDKFVKSDDKTENKAGEQGTITCYVCSENLGEANKASGKDRVKPGLVEIASEGTGFAAAGGNVIKKDGVAFGFG